jgi:hypothetical protein
MSDQGEIAASVQEKPVEFPPEPLPEIAPKVPEPVAPRPHKITILLGLMSPLFAMTAIVVSFMSFRTSQSSLALSQRSLKIGQRAYVQPHLSLSQDNKMYSSEGFYWPIQLELKNTGNTPASMKLISVKSEQHPVAPELQFLADSHPPKPLGFVEQALRNQTISIGAKESESLDMGQIEILKKDIADAHPSLPPKVFVLIEADYADVFSDIHHSTIDCEYYYDEARKAIFQGRCQTTSD